MTTTHYIALDTHCHTTDICVQTRAHRPARRFRVPTTIPALRQIIEAIPRPRHLTFEEGPLAHWLWRNLQPHVDALLVCDPRRNALIAKDGPKDDPLDAAKLNDLFIGGYLRPVHHPESLHREALKQTVGLYHRQVSRRVRLANQVIGYLRRWGVVTREKDWSPQDQRPALWKRVLQEVAHLENPAAPPTAPTPATENTPGPTPPQTPEATPENPMGGAAALVHLNLHTLWTQYDSARQAERHLHRQLVRLGQHQEQVRRWRQIPGIGPIRAITLLAYLDVPGRFPSKQALWKYLGLGLVHAQSGSGPAHVRVEHAANRVLKNAILGAAASAIRQGDNPFAQQHRAWQAQGLSPKNARRNVARSQAAVLWGMWKSGAEYDPDRVGLAAAVT